MISPLLTQAALAARPDYSGRQGIMSQGKTIFLDPASGSDSHTGLSVKNAVATLPAAFALLTANQNDVLVYLAGSSAINLSAALDWNKSYTHFVGIAAPVTVGSRARIFQTSTATGLSPLITVSASGCMFENLYIFQGVNDATSKVNVSVTGLRNHFLRCHFAGIGHATMDVAGAASLNVSGSENVFEECAIGLDTISRGANSVELLFPAAAAATRNRFLNCLIYAYISAAGHALVKVADGTAIDRYQIFDRCLFQTDSVNQTVSQTSVFSLPAGIVQGKIILKDCACLTDGTPDWDSSNRGILWNNTVAAAAAGAGGLATKQ